MKKLLFYATAVFGLAVLFTNCKKTEDDNTPVSQPTKEELLAGSTSKSWGLSKMVVNGYDITTYIPACEKDNIMIFKKNNVITTDEGATKCSEQDPQTYDGTWSLNNAKTELSIIDGGDTTVATITELTSTTMKLSSNSDGEQKEVTLLAK